MSADHRLVQNNIQQKISYKINSAVIKCLGLWKPYDKSLQGKITLKKFPQG